MLLRWNCSEREVDDRNAIAETVRIQSVALLSCSR